MIHRIAAIIIVLSLCLNFSTPVLSCDEEQTNVYVTQILFGDGAVRYENDKNVELLQSALYICSEQSSNQGQAHLRKLKEGKVSSVPSVAKINLKASKLFACSHNAWACEVKNYEDTQENRRNVLRKTVVKVFDFGWFNETFRSKDGKIDSFSALLYYSHILADYLADDPEDTEVAGKVPAYSGTTKYAEDGYPLNGNIPTFSNAQKREATPYKEYSDLDEYGRCGAGIACIGPDTIENAEARPSLSNISPTGWIDGNVYYQEEGVTANELYNRCHLIARELGGANTLYNLITGTRYLNEAMISYENKVANYIKKTGNHVIYRVTPVYKGDNAVTSGVQLEAYSVEDEGELSFNVYLYNVQPGVDINYTNGSSSVADTTLNANGIIPFAVDNPNDSNPDLMYEIQRQLAILFEDQKESDQYATMMNDLDDIASKARNVSGTKDWEVYKKLKPLQYDYLEALSKHVPKLLANESFFNAVFN